MPSARLLLVATLVFLSFASPACDDGDAAPTPADAAPAAVDAGPPAFTVDGVVALQTPPASGETLVLWVRPGGDAMRFYALGRGEQTGGSFRVDVPVVPAAEALDQGLGVGAVQLYPDGTALPASGFVELSELPFPPLASSGRHAIIYRAPGADTSTYPWVADFPEGFACGACVDQAEGKDTYAPVSCDLVELVQISDTDLDAVCLWN